VAVRRSWLLKLVLGLALICVAAYATRGVWLRWIGYCLVHDDGPAKADCAVVLAGDPYGNRIVRGAELVQKGYVPMVLVSGPPGFYGVNEADLAIQFAVGKGFPREWFIPVRHRGLSTRGEAKIFLDELRQRNLHSFLLVTSDFHTARARRIFLGAERDKGYEAPFRTVAAPDAYFLPDGWWHDREARKITLLEWVKTVATEVGM
jgi:uncharacterized SAM-binding protein YcdF (DUF218 family)